MFASHASLTKQPLKKPKYSEFNAIELAQYIIDKSREMGQPINNLQLQKILYFTWLNYYRRTKKVLFENTICAWNYGPVIPDVYDWFKVWGTSWLPCQNSNVFFNTELCKTIVDDCIFYYGKIKALKLAEMSRVRGGAWDIVFRHGYGNGFVITFDLMEKTSNREIIKSRQFIIKQNYKKAGGNNNGNR